MARKDETGNRYGRLVVKEFSHSDGSFVFWKCICDCGNEKVTRGHTLRIGKCKSCGVCDIQAKPEPDKPEKLCYRGLKAGAKSRNLVFELSYQDFIRLSQQNCFFCGKPPYDKRYGFTKRRKSKGIEHDVVSVFNSIDRVDSSKGYFNGNVVPCCIMCNRMKSDFSLQEFMHKIAEIYKNLLER